MKRIIALILALALAVSCFTVFSASAASTSTLKSKIAELESKSKALEKKIAAVKAEKKEPQKVKNMLNEQIANLEEQISVYVDRIAELKSSISKYQKQIDEKEAVIQNTKDTLKQRVRLISMSSAGGNEAIMILSSANFGDYLTGRGFVRSITSKDRSIVDEMNEAIAEIKESKSVLDEQIAEQNSLKAELDAKNNQIKAKRAEVNQILAELNSKQASLEKQNGITEAEINRITKEIQAATGSGSSGKVSADKSIVYKGGKFAWPVPGYYGISSYYGYRWGSLHAGIDISSSGINGKPIVAAADGQVLVSGWSSGGYGYYVTINHGYMDGKNYTTLYGHMSRTACSAGQRVKRGQVIGYVGSTGWSTGPHCHFEVRINGSTVNPLPYLK